MLSDIYFKCRCRNLQIFADSCLAARQHHGQLAVRGLPPQAVRSILDRQMDRMLYQAAFFPEVRGSMLFVMIPQTKQASSLAIAATATFFFFPWRIIL